MNVHDCFMCDIELDPDDETVAKVKFVWGSDAPAKVAEVCEVCLADLLMVGSLVKMAHIGAKWAN